MIWKQLYGVAEKYEGDGVMKVAVIGSRGLYVDDLERYLPEDTTEIISGGAQGVDESARVYALRHGLKLTEYLPECNAAK
jgi:predicted Rossmann fold nucleotide-binding protein DprA/Smf involved in DNA uptake